MDRNNIYKITTVIMFILILLPLFVNAQIVQVYNDTTADSAQEYAVIDDTNDKFYYYITKDIINVVDLNTFTLIQNITAHNGCTIEGNYMDSNTNDIVSYCSSNQNLAQIDRITFAVTNISVEGDQRENNQFNVDDNNLYIIDSSATDIFTNTWKCSLSTTICINESYAGFTANEYGWSIALDDTNLFTVAVEDDFIQTNVMKIDKTDLSLTDSANITQFFPSGSVSAGCSIKDMANDQNFLYLWDSCLNGDSNIVRVTKSNMSFEDWFDIATLPNFVDIAGSRLQCDVNERFFGCSFEQSGDTTTQRLFIIDKDTQEIIHNITELPSVGISGLLFLNPTEDSFALMFTTLQTYYTFTAPALPEPPVINETTSIFTISSVECVQFENKCFDGVNKCLLVNDTRYSGDFDNFDEKCNDFAFRDSFLLIGLLFFFGILFLISGYVFKIPAFALVGAFMLLFLGIGLLQAYIIYAMILIVLMIGIIMLIIFQFY